MACLVRFFTRLCVFTRRPLRVKAPQCIKRSRDTAETSPGCRECQSACVYYGKRYWTDVADIHCAWQTGWPPANNFSSISLVEALSENSPMGTNQLHGHFHPTNVRKRPSNQNRFTFLFSGLVPSEIGSILLDTMRQRRDRIQLFFDCFSTTRMGWITLKLPLF